LIFSQILFVIPFCVCVRRDISSPKKGKFDDDGYYNNHIIAGNLVDQ